MTNNLRYLKRAALLLVVFGFHITVAAQTSPTVKRPPTTKPQAAATHAIRVDGPSPTPAAPSPPAMPVPFPTAMLESGKIDIAYAGHDPNAIFAALEAATNVKKGEFESSSTFEDRRTKSLSAPYLPGLKFTDQLGFIVEVRKVGKYFSGVGYSFDADAAEVSLYVSLADSVPNEIGSPNFQMSDYARRQARSPLKVQALHSQKPDEREYQASNAYGATVTVTESTLKTVQLGLGRLDFVPLRKAFSENPQPVTKLKMDAMAAARELPGLKALFLVRPSSPFVDYNFTHQKPTRENPRELIIQTRIVRAVADEIVFYSGITGEIIHRVKQN